MKVIAGFLVVLALVIGVGIWWTTQRVDGIVATAIEDTASALLGSEVEVAGVDVDLRAGSATVRGLTVANPTGENHVFSTEPALQLGAVTVAIDLARLDLENLAGAPIPLTLVRIAEPTVNAEVTPAGINLEVLRRNVAAAPSAPEPEEGPPVQLSIGRFEFADGMLRADTSAVAGEVREIELPGLQLENLRGTPQAVGKRVLDAFLGAAVRQAARDRLSREVEDELDALKEKASDAFRSLLGVEERE